MEVTKMNQDLINKLEEAISDWYSIMNYDDKEELSWIRKNITQLKRQLRVERGKTQQS